MRTLFTILTAVLLLTGCGEQQDGFSHLIRCEKMKLVSMAPNVTEILYALDLEDQLVGVSKFSNYPPEAKHKPIVGGTYDPNWEMIVSLQPDLVIGLDSQKEIAAQLRSLNIKFLGVPHERIDEIMQSILTVGEACGKTNEAQQIFQGLEKQLRHSTVVSKPWKYPPPASRTPPEEGNQDHPALHMTQKSPPSEGCPQGGVGLKRPRVLVCVGHDEQLTRMYVAARNTFYDDLITLAGGTNACEQTAIKYPEISPEGLHAMQPDLIIDLVTPGQPSSNVWKNNWVQAQPAVVTITNDYAFIPGPRFGLLLEDFIRAIHE